MPSFCFLSKGYQDNPFRILRASGRGRRFGQGSLSALRAISAGLSNLHFLRFS